jgi:hypothetical protein
MIMLGTYRRLNLHVLAPWRNVVRAAHNKLDPASRRDPDRREARKSFYRQMLKHHRDAQQIVHRFRL